MDAIFTRRSVRRFTEQPVEAEKVEQLMKAAMQAPSASNQQPWHFYVIHGRENIDALAKYSPYAICLEGAPLAIVTMADSSIFTRPGNWQQDMGAATQNILLQAVELGLGTCWLAAAPDEDKTDYIRNLYQLPDTMLPYCVIALGYPLREGANRFVDRYDGTRVHHIGE